MAEFVAEQLTVGGAGGVLVSDLSMSVQSGEVVGITGPSGSGKTSLLHVLGGLSRPASGRILLGGQPVSPWRDAGLGLILQDLHLMATLTAHETVALPMQVRGVPRAEVAESSDQALADLGLGDHSHRRIDELSGGQRQRVAVARALAGQPDLIFADEPTAALDPDWRSVVVDQLWAAARGGAIVIIASGDPELIRRCDRIVTLA